MIKMETNPQNASGDQPNPVSDNSEGKDKVAYETYRKVLGEKKKRDAEVQELRDRLNAIELDKKQAEGNKDEVIASLRSELEKSKSQVSETKKNFAWNIMQSQIKSEAVNRGCKNPDGLIRLLSKDDLASIEIDDQFNVNKDDLSRVLDGVAERNADWDIFKKESKKVHDVNNSVNHFKTPPKKLDDMSTEELEQELARLESQG